MKNVPRTADGKVDLNAPPQRTPDGKIDLSGFWMPTNPVKHLLNLAADLKPGERAAAAVGRGASTRSASRPTARIIRACAAGPRASPRS